jgi:hypothetical protein
MTALSNRTFYTVAAVFTPEQKQQLRSFCEVCDAIQSCRFIRDFGNQAHHIFIGTLPDGTVKDEWPRYDDDDFRALMTHYRKLRQEGETKFERIVNLVKRVSDTNDRQKLDDAKDQVKAEGTTWWGAALRDENGEWIMYNQEQLDDLIRNGEVFHRDQGKQLVLRQLTGKNSLMKSVAFWNYITYLLIVIGNARDVATMIRERGYLD